MYTSTKTMQYNATLSKVMTQLNTQQYKHSIKWNINAIKLFSSNYFPCRLLVIIIILWNLCPENEIHFVRFFPCLEVISFIFQIIMYNVQKSFCTFAIRASKLGSGRKDRFEINFFLHVGHSLFLHAVKEQTQQNENDIINSCYVHQNRLTTVKVTVVPAGQTEFSFPCVYRTCTAPRVLSLQNYWEDPIPGPYVYDSLRDANWNNFVEHI